MRIAYVCSDPGVPVFGRKGASVHVQAVITALLRRGAEVHLICARTSGEAPPELAGVQVHQITRARHSDPGEREAACQRADTEVIDILDRLHEAGPLDLVYERYSLWGRSASLWSRAAGLPHLLEVNAPLVSEQALHRVLVDRAGAEAVAASAMSATTAALCVSDQVADWARGFAADPTRVHTVANGVDTTRITPAPTDETPTFTVGFVGTLKPWHGVPTLLDALALMLADDPSYRLLLVGEGPQREALQQQADRLGITDQVELTGALDPAAIPAQLHRMHVAVAPYPAGEDFYFSPLKLYEYLAAGLPTVASMVGNLPDLLGQGRLGVLVEPEEPRKLADAITALRHDPARRRQLGDAGRQEVVAQHDWSAVVDRALSFAWRS
ncbi:glycosyltransferase family 4 protein [Ruania zhangjianzhongii]|uniref:glycosyltransferase family 4 protein n=1 Tax=Ruania zhangjianzhongii TaxID=2603206 RepID=UPI0011C7BF6B|nr:glycosyltransferase family 4 protein [Ruania zhangjianzhongii]